MIRKAERRCDGIEDFKLVHAISLRRGTTLKCTKKKFTFAVALNFHEASKAAIHLN